MPRTRSRPKRLLSTPTKRETSSDDGTEAALEELTRPELLAIHRAFGAAAAGRPSAGRPTEPSCAAGGSSSDDNDLPGGSVREEVMVQPGGFVREEESVELGGGFVPEEGVGEGGFIREDIDQPVTPARSETPASARTIGLAQVPDALKTLGLPYRDSEILEIFEDVASSGDERSDEGRIVRRHGERVKRVRRADFARVCAVLMAARRGEGSPRASSGSDGEAKHDGSAYGDGSDAALSSSGSDDSGSFRPSRRPTTPKKRNPRSAKKPRYGHEQESKREVVVGLKTRQVRRHNKITSTHGHRNGVGTGTGTDDDDEDDKGAAANTFRLFFGTAIEGDDLRHRSIGFEEIKRVLTELGEGMTDEEIKEMLDYASYSNDSRVSLEAFEKLVKEIRTV